MFQKAYKALYSRESAAEKGTLYYYKVLLRRTDANGNVKSNFKAHWDLLITVGCHLMIEQALEYFGMDTTESQPTKNQPPEGIEASSRQTRQECLQKMLRDFLLHYGYGQFSLGQPTVDNRPQEEEHLVTTYKILGKTADGKVLVIPVQASSKPPAEDRLLNYASNLCHWAMQLMSMDDTAKEGDIDRLMLNCKYNLPFFFSHSKLSKYFVENMDYVLKAQHLLAPKTQLRILDGSFVNMRGGQGHNVEADLVQEFSVRNRKELVRHLGANKTEKAIKRVTNAADAIAAMSSSFDKVVKVSSPSGRHCKHTSEEDKQKISTTLREVRPFCRTPGRLCTGFPTINKTPFSKIDTQLMTEFLKRNITRICMGQAIHVEEEEEEEEEVEDDVDNNDDLPQL